MTGERVPICSIGMPVYNGENFIREAIQSVIDQDFKDFELIISDNASSDGTGSICQEFAARDDRIIYVRQPRNIGAAKNYNYVFHLAKGKYFNWLAHDDVLKPGFLARCVSELDSLDNSTILVYPDFEYIDGKGELSLEDEMPTCVYTDAQSPAKRLYETLERLKVVTSIFGLFRRDALAKTRLIGSYIASDYVLLAECALIGKIRRLETGDALFQRRLHESGSQRANRTPAEVAAWFDPDALVDNHPSRRVNREFLNSVLLTPGLSLWDKAQSSLYLVLQRLKMKRIAWANRRARNGRRSLQS